MRKDVGSRSKSSLDQLTGTYLRARWWRGAGMIALTLVLVTFGRAGAEMWAIAGAGAMVLAHAFAMQMWDRTNVTVALLLDATATGLAAMFMGSISNDHLPIALAFVGAVTLISLFTGTRTRVMILAYMSALTLASHARGRKLGAWCLHR